MGLDFVASWNNSSVDWAVAARVRDDDHMIYDIFYITQAHCHYIVLKAFSSAIDTADLCEANLNILQSLYSLFGIFGIIQYFGEFSLVRYNKYT